MGLRSQILSNPETVSDLAVAAEARFRDGESLFAQGRHQGCVYILGLSAEMWLKYAAFRCAGAGISHDVASLLGPARAMMRAHLHHVANRLFEDWKIDLRYSSISVTERNSWRSYCDVAWLRANASMLWS